MTALDSGNLSAGIILSVCTLSVCLRKFCCAQPVKIPPETVPGPTLNVSLSSDSGSHVNPLFNCSDEEFYCGSSEADHPAKWEDL